MVHKCSKEDEIADIQEHLKKLDPLIGLTPTLQEIVDEKKAAIIMTRKVVKWLGVIATIGAIIWSALQIHRTLK